MKNYDIAFTVTATVAAEDEAAATKIAKNMREEGIEVESDTPFTVTEAAEGAGDDAAEAEAKKAA